MELVTLDVLPSEESTHGEDLTTASQQRKTSNRSTTSANPLREFTTCCEGDAVNYSDETKSSASGAGTNGMLSASQKTDITPRADHLLIEISPRNDDILKDISPGADNLLSGISPRADYLLSDTSPRADCLLSDTAPRADCLLSDTAPRADYLLSDTAPRADYLLSDTSPRADYLLSDTSPRADCLLSDTSPRADCLLSDTSPRADYLLSDTSPRADYLLSDISPRADCLLSDTSPRADHLLSDISPRADYLLSDTSPRADYLLSDTSPRADHLLSDISPRADCLLSDTSPRADCLLNYISPEADHLIEISPINDDMLKDISPRADHLLSGSPRADYLLSDISPGSDQLLSDISPRADHLLSASQRADHVLSGSPRADISPRTLLTDQITNNLQESFEDDFLTNGMFEIPRCDARSCTLPPSLNLLSFEHPSLSNLDQVQSSSRWIKLKKIFHLRASRKELTMKGWKQFQCRPAAAEKATQTNNCDKLGNREVTYPEGENLPNVWTVESSTQTDGREAVDVARIEGPDNKDAPKVTYKTFSWTGLKLSLGILKVQDERGIGEKPEKDGMEEASRRIDTASQSLISHNSVSSVKQWSGNTSTKKDTWAYSDAKGSGKKDAWSCDDTHKSLRKEDWALGKATMTLKKENNWTLVDAATCVKDDWSFGSASGLIHKKDALFYRGTKLL